MRIVSFVLQGLRWRSVACQWWRFWEAQGGAYHGLRRLPQTRLALLAAERAEAAARMADFFESLADVYPLGLGRRSAR